MSVNAILKSLHDAGIKLGYDGNSLDIKAPQGALTVDLRESLLQHKAAIIDTLKLVAEMPAQTSGIGKRPNLAEYPLSTAQERLWMVARLEADSAAYNVPYALQIKGALDVSSLAAAINKVVQRHETLRARFSTQDGQPVQTIDQSFSFKLETQHIPQNGSNDVSNLLRQSVREEALRPFKLDRDRLIRGRLLSLSEQHHVLLITMHHIVSDGWSMNLMFQEISDFYQAFHQQTAPIVVPLQIQYADFAYWQKLHSKGSVADKQLAYWVNYLEAVAPLELPLDYRRENIKGCKGASIPINLDSELVVAIRRTCRTQHITLSMFLSAAYSILLHKYSAQNDIVFGKPIANRELAETENLIGFFVNMLIERVDLSANPSVKDLYKQVKENAIASYDNQDLPFERIVDAIKSERSQNKNPIFQVVLALQSDNATASGHGQSAHALSLADCEVSDYEADIETTRFDIELHLLESKSAVRGAWIYDTDLFNAATIEAMCDALLQILQQMVLGADKPVSEIRSVSDARLQLSSKNLLQTETNYPADKSVCELFQQQVEDTPHAIAATFEGQQLNYQSLNSKSNQLAHYLRARGVKAEVMVGICIERSFDMIIAILGILKAGGAYVPLDPEYPVPRLRFMLEDTSASVLVTQSSLKPQLPDFQGNVVCLDQDWLAIEKESPDNPVSDVSADSLMYVIYTSGSTGKPKGVCVEHRSAVRLVKNTNYVNIKPQDVFLQFAPVAFDASTFEIWGSLLNGAKLVIYPPQKSSLEQLGKFIEKNAITTLWFTSALFNQMVDQYLQSFIGVKTLLAGGEALSITQVKKYLNFLKHAPATDHVLINGYGPTENTTFTCCHVMTQDSEIGQSVPIGRPISNTQVYVLDSQGWPVPVGAPGELYIGGDGLARGYLKRPELTAQKFVSAVVADHPHRRLYRTGDQVRYRNDGVIEFMGRFDHQVKLRGFRIELGEVEAIIGSHDAVREAVVMLREAESGDKRLVVYLVLDEKQEPSIEQIREYAREQLPEYMLPSAFVVLDSLPLTPNGKVDRDVLEQTGVERHVETDYVPPRTHAEQQMTSIWREFLNVENPGIDDNFFDLGGNSLLLMRAHAKMCAVTGSDLPVTHLFQYPTIRGLARQLAGLEQGRIPATLDKVRQRAQKQRDAMLRQKRANTTR